MNFYLSNTIYDFFNVSVILPFYKKMKEFRNVLPANLQYYRRNGIELVIVLDTPEEEHELVEFLDHFPFLNFKVIINRVPHEWRNPAKAINVGIRHATMKYILVMSPETEFLTDMIYQLRYILQYYKNTYAIGQVIFADMDDMPDIKNIYELELLAYGSIMVERAFLQQINGYSERRIEWGGDDDNIRARLDAIGLKKMFVPQAVGIHREENAKGHSGRYRRNAAMPVEVFSAIYYPKQPSENSEDWGKDFGELLYCWSERRSKERQCTEYLSDFCQYWISSPSIFQQSFRNVALIQIKNEIKHLPEVLLHLEKHCDGIILLDDNSMDGSYEAAMSGKLLMKVQKQACPIFDDLKLRNILLELAAFITTNWLFFFDADERFADHFADLEAITRRPEFDSASFYLVHLWDHESFYKTNLPEKADGILSRIRMFRSYGPLRITSNRELHFPAAPFTHKNYNAPVLIKHYGNVDPATRRMKYDRYTAQDREGITQGHSYDYLIEEYSTLASVEELLADFVPKK